MKTHLIAAVISLVASVLPAQSQVRKGTPPLPSFEVASVKLDRSSVPIARYRALDDRFNATLTVRGLIAMAYDCNFDQISGGPQWIKTRFFDIDAKVDENDWAKLSFDQRLDQIKLMVRSLLADRFKLKVIHQTKDLPIYVLALATNGPKFSEDHSRINRERTGITAQGPGQLELVSAPLSKFTNLLAIMPDLEGRLIVDKTGLRGNYSFTLEWAPGNAPPRPGPLANSTAPADASRPSLFTALQEQLGLRLESTKGPVDILVIDHVEQPTPN